MVNSILENTKKMLGLAPEYKAFDTDIIIHINSVFSTLTQLGLGPPNGFMIDDDINTWEDFMGADLNISSVKTYMYLRVRLLFDPPATSFHINAVQEQIKEFEWRLNTHREGVSWTEPVTTLPSAEPVW